MSGTSGDGASLALASFPGRGFRLLGHATYPYPRKLADRLQDLPALRVAEASSLHFELGRDFARAAVRFLAERRVRTSRLRVVGCHGHTFYHGPRDRVPSTFQAGETSFLAAALGADVVSDFRSADVAAGGQGAPLLPFFDEFFFGGGPVRALQNIGGISNVAVVGKELARPIAFDNGPGNCLMDWAARKVSGGALRCDVSGRLAKKGRIDFAWVRSAAKRGYFTLPPPKSAGREIFNGSWLSPGLRAGLKKNPEDVLATLTYLTAFAIRDSYRRFLRGTAFPEEVVVSGGGALNPVLMAHLRDLFSPVPVLSIERFGMHPQAKEPLAFAFFAWRAVHGRVNHLPAATGAREALVLGKITPARRRGRQ
ncbi:MAG: hypothetical protein A2902_06615 [Elusimicrobia bacterium RIFCSPLOWO2_01_FULL_64_13]|nr:MAG: hypothetical protein A2636_03010 [Elusimicrobia bacterium RIFCSPHIGHO2_01_FULL_64_10]OGR97642.1 MAG: hypothetical protein A2902_06615 [Elusimicrobia bacterium RIFCSPLOWO2_01_FULL_64_13]